MSGTPAVDMPRAMFLCELARTWRAACFARVGIS